MPENQLGSLIAREVAAAEEMNTAFRERSASLITAAGGLVAVLTGLLAVAAGSREDVLPPSGRPWLATSMISLVAATLLAMCMYLPRRVAAADAAALGRYVEESWTADGWERRIAELGVEHLADLRRVGHMLAYLYIAALASALVAVVSLAGLAWRIFVYLS